MVQTGKTQEEKDQIKSENLRVPFLRAEGISKSFPGVIALDQVNFEIYPGEIVSLTGENGSGKSTLSKVIGGLINAEKGQLYINNEIVKISNPNDALQLGIVLISQELTLAQTLSVAENILLGRLPKKAGMIDWNKARKVAKEILDQLGVDIDVDQRVDTLSVELQQEIEIARAISCDAKLLILDEATSSLSEVATQRLMNVVRGLAAKGVAVVMITHRMPEIYSTCDRAVVLRDGKLVGKADIPETKESELVRMMVGRELVDYYGSRNVSIGNEVLKVAGLSTKDGLIKNLNFLVREGEILGVAGLVGSGKAELAMALSGAITAMGEVKVTNQTLKLGSPTNSINIGIGYVPDDRKRAGLLPVRTITENISIAWGKKDRKFGFINTFKERKKVDQIVSDYGIKTSSLDKEIALLSGGNQQKAILGRQFAQNFPVYVLNEPTRGVDVGSKSSIYEFIQRLAESGAAIVLISSELPEIIGLADKTMVLFQGELKAMLSKEEMTEETIGSYAVSGTYSN